MRKRKFAGAIAGLSLLAFLVGSWAIPRGAAGAEKVRFVFNWIPYALHTGFYVAKERGYYKAAGFDVTLDRGFGSSKTAKMIAAGVADLGLADFPAVIRGRATAGMEIKAVGILLDRSVNVIYARDDRGIRKPSDLIGKTIGAPKVSALRSTFPALAKINGIDPNGVKWINIPPAGLHAAVLSGKVDSIATFSTVGPKFLPKALKNNVTIIPVLFSDFGLDLYSVAMIAHDKSIKGNPNQLRRFVEASWRGVAYAVENPGQGVKDLLKNQKTLSEATERRVWRIVVNHMLTPYQRTHGLGQMSAAKTKLTRDITFQAHNITKDIPIEDLYTNAFLPKLFPSRTSW